MIDNDLSKQLENAFGAVQQSDPPPFDEIWHAARLQYRRGRRRYAITTGIAAALAVAAIGFWSTKPEPVDDEYLIAEALLNRTQWSAPSDVLLPEHEYDVYREVPFLVEPTNLDEGSLL